MPSGGGAGRFRVRTGLPPARRGASPPANPCSLVDKHHAPRPEPAFHRLGVVLHSPQTLVPSSTGTTPLGSNRPSTGSAWCFTPRKPLFLRQQAPRPRVRTGFPPIRRGASLPANPCSFVDGHHAPRHEPAFLQFSVVLLSPQALVPSSTSTTPPGSNVSSGGSAWCFPPRKPMFLRRRAPRPQARTGLDVGNGSAGSFCPHQKIKKRIARYVQCAFLLNDPICLNDLICVPFPPRPCGLR